MLCPRCSRRYDDEHRFCPHDGTQLTPRPDIRRIRTKPSENVGMVVGGRYQVRGLIGAGGMAEVFLAQDKTTGDPVAVKILNARHLKDPMKKARFMLEATAGAKIRHDNVLEVLDVGLRDDGAPYLVMEYLSGESLGDWLRRERVMNAAMALPLLIQIASGLAAAHRAGIVHRDIKPGNVFLIGERGAPHTAKVVDFGFARLAEFRGLTQAGMAVGTIEYMAPEQAVGDAAEVRTDIYGLGVVMYRMFTGRIPFSMRNDAELLAHHFLVPPPPPSLGQEGIAPRIEAVVRKALRKNLDNRYATMDALIGDLERVTHPSGPTVALAPITEPDEYKPLTPFAANTAGYYRRLLSRPAPSGA
ncbi:serine/threonine-protein kinase [Chondromyces crocatus]|uniref:Protein kinase n=1 Tax=Chondromyces crocatus TaxID=52 RepID=A0A0K1ELG2_CHOCO|nr:serine/threonine-protein kinase [Chondromyces crocatus]AKT41720.1 protein kinase [Chondromyces crocatus]